MRSQPKRGRRFDCPRSAVRRNDGSADSATPSNRRTVEPSNARRCAIQNVTQAVTQQVQPKTEEDGGAGNVAYHQRSAGNSPRADHGAPFRRRWLCADPDEAQARRPQDGQAHVHRGLYQDRRGQVRQDLPERDAPATAPHAPRRLDERLGLHRERLPLHQPDIPGPPDKRKGDHGVGDPGPQRRHDGNSQNQAGDRQEHVGDPHDAFARPAAQVRPGSRMPISRPPRPRSG
jgi:hypothetical protein